MTAINGIRRIFRLTFATDNMIVQCPLKIHCLLLKCLLEKICDFNSIVIIVVRLFNILTE